MRLQKILQRKQLRGVFSPQLLLLCLCIVCGAVIGFFVQKAVSPTHNAELSDYLQQYAARSADADGTAISFLRVAAVYFRYPLLAFFLGFCTVGTYLLPLLCAVQGFFLAYSVCCFASALGHAGIYLAFTAFGPRVMLTLPCLLLLALQGFGNAKTLLGTDRRRNARTKKLPAASYFVPLGICTVVLLIGTVLEIVFLPRLFRWVLLKLM